MKIIKIMVRFTIAMTWIVPCMVKGIDNMQWADFRHGQPTQAGKILVWDEREKIPKVVNFDGKDRYDEENGRIYLHPNHYYTWWIIIHEPVRRQE